MAAVERMNSTEGLFLEPCHGRLINDIVSSVINAKKMCEGNEGQPEESGNMGRRVQSNP